MILPLMAVGAVAVAVAWRLVVSGRISIWLAMSATSGLLGLAALATGQVPLSPKVWWPVAGAAGLGAGLGLYAATVAVVSMVRRWPAFDRHVRDIYDQRRGLALGPALLLSAGVNAAGEELFWRGLFQWRLSRAAGWAGATAATWGAYALVNLASQNLPIVAAGVVGGAAWGMLALWSHGALASVLCHSAWTGLMLVFPPGGTAPGERPSG